MMAETPLISVIIPAYNAEAFIERAISSVKAQDYPTLELIVIDDGSTDATGVIVKKHSDVHYCHQENAGVSSARNKGVDCSSGEFLSFLDADDIWQPEKLSLQLAALRQEPAADYVLSYMFVDAPVELTLPEEIHRGLVALPYPMSLLISQQEFSRVGGFNPELRICEDTDWLFRARDLGLVEKVLPMPLVTRNFNGNNLSLTTAPQLKHTLLGVVSASIKRKRGVS
jgi:glycosyltransferase involved in cell wall biosynthesis